ncbi:heavy-metal-associated domain-containing protein [Pseudoalteromonas spongiae]|uniref:heavy-metal-associated domain-containing protein n=1 Tax=Pseudoalteromonas spongiae TaxID=298657 RepID=UPI000C2D6067|nr:heavy-metal-associated domain-containing protein [Pseudoalteromonas spongiae]
MLTLKSTSAIVDLATSVTFKVVGILKIKETAMLKITINEMTCNHCANTIKSAIKALDRCALIDINLADNEIKIASMRTKHDLITTVERIGYRINKVNGEVVT